MRAFSATLVCLALLSWVAACPAGVIGVAADDGDGAINCTGTWAANPLWTPGSELDAGTMSIVGQQYWGPGHVGTEGLDDTAYFAVNGDPTVKLITSIDNDTTFAWTGYHVNVYMDQPFTLSVPTVTYDSWTVANLGTYPLSAALVGGQYVATIDYVGGSPLPIGDTLDFSYKLTFTGSVHYCQEMFPIPEPGTIALVLTGLVGLVIVGRKFAR
jgi:hypothetical protein